MTKKLSPEKRKQQIEQAAFQLFKEKGYENTSISEILEEVGISKGGFYYHFNSKEELLEEISKMIMEKAVKIPRKIFKRKDLTAMEKLNKYMREVNLFKLDKPEEFLLVLEGIYSGKKNLKLEHKIFEYIKESMYPLIESIINQGMEEGDFQVDYPEETARLYVNLLFIYGREISPLFVEALNKKDKKKIHKVIKKCEFFQGIIEDILGLKKGTLNIEEIVQEVINQFWADYAK